jgi:drug/metabolite transporter (DMT)-like permease
MGLAIVLALAASLCTATSSICQRLGARHVDERGFDAMLVFRLARQPTWLLGFACMIAGFAFQISALRYGPLALVQPILAVELLFVFSYLALRSRDTCRACRREWAAAIAMSVGIGVFLGAAAPTGGQDHAPAGTWWLAGAGTLVAVSVAVAAGRRGSPARRAACLGIGTGIAWGFIAAVIKELSSHLSGGPAAIFGNWSVYVLMGVGVLAMLLASHAMTAGPLAASQPGFTIGDPVTAILLGVFAFNERLGTSPADLAAEVIGLVVLVLGVWTLSRSELVTSRSLTKDRLALDDGGHQAASVEPLQSDVRQDAAHHAVARSRYVGGWGRRSAGTNQETLFLEARNPKRARQPLETGGVADRQAGRDPLHAAGTLAADRGEQSGGGHPADFLKAWIDAGQRR